jgi:S-formylglutathione hydrolase
MHEPVLHEGSFESALIPSAAQYRVITPPGWTRGERLPLLLVLHGAVSSAAVLDGQLPLYAELWSNESVPRMVVASVSTPTVGGFYIDRTDGGGRWESLVADAFPRFLEHAFNVDLARVLLMGASMGGYGALKISFRRPAHYLAVAALVPAVFPGEVRADVRPRNTFGVLERLLEAMGQGNGDDQAYADNHVVALLRANAEAIRRHGLPILIECGDQDSFNLHDGTEYLHRALWDLGVSHDYHLIRDEDHVGPGSVARQRAGVVFLGKVLAHNSSAPPLGARSQLSSAASSASLMATSSSGDHDRRPC